MKSTLLLCLLLAYTSLTLSAQIVVDFADATLGDTSFMAGGIEWKMTDDFLISEFDNFSCSGLGGVNRYMDSGYLFEGGSEGVVGSVAPVAEAATFQMATATSQCIWIGNFDGEFISTGTIKFTGFQTDGGTVEQSFEVQSLSFSDLVAIDFAPATWDGVELSSLQVEITDTQDSTDYVAIDNLTFASITPPVSSVSAFEELGKSIFPNPTTGTINFGLDQVDRAEVYDGLGRKLQTFNAPGITADLGDLAPGLYVLKVWIGSDIYTTNLAKY